VFNGCVFIYIAFWQISLKKSFAKYGKSAFHLISYSKRTNRKPTSQQDTVTKSNKNKL